MNAKIATLLAAVLACGCAHRLGDFTVISSKNVDLTRGADFKRGVGGFEVEGTPLIDPVVAKAYK